MRLMAALALALVGCGGAGSAVDDTSGGASEPAVMKVRVYADGRITQDDVTVSLQELVTAFAGLAEREGAVWYFREQTADEPHSNASAVIEAVVDAQLPISMSIDEDFSTVLLPDGTVKPRR